MNGRINIDGYKLKEGVEVVIHGEQPDPAAMVNISLRIHNNKAVRLVLLQALRYIEAGIEAGEPEEDGYVKESAPGDSSEKRFLVIPGGKVVE